MIRLQEWRLSGNTFLFKGWPVFTRTGGNPGGPALLLIHGFPTASWDWNKIWPALGEHFSLYTLDMIGFGDSAKPMEFSYRISEQADLIEAWLQDCNVSTYHILAHDYGDTVAQELLARNLERKAKGTDPQLSPRVLSTCLLNGGLFPETHRPALIQKLLLSPLGPLVGKLTSKRTFAANLKRVFGESTPPTAEEIDSFWELLLANEGRKVLHRLITYMPQRTANRSRWVGAIRDAQIPVKLIDGLADPISGAHMVARYRELIPATDVTELPNIGHYPQVEAPVNVVQTYLSFAADFT